MAWRLRCRQRMFGLHLAWGSKRSLLWFMRHIEVRRGRVLLLRLWGKVCGMVEGLHGGVRGRGDSMVCMVTQAALALVGCYRALTICRSEKTGLWPALRQDMLPTYRSLDGDVPDQRNGHLHYRSIVNGSRSVRLGDSGQLFDARCHCYCYFCLLAGAFLPRPRMLDEESGDDSPSVCHRCHVGVIADVCDVPLMLRLLRGSLVRL